MLPVIILATHHHGLLYPNAALRQLENTLDQRPAKVEPFRVGVKHINARTVFDNAQEVGIDLQQKVKEGSIP
jgi:hypothetical protein